MKETSSDQGFPELPGSRADGRARGWGSQNIRMQDSHSFSKGTLGTTDGDCKEQDRKQGHPQKSLYGGIDTPSLICILMFRKFSPLLKNLSMLMNIFKSTSWRLESSLFDASRFPR